MSLTGPDLEQYCTRADQQGSRDLQRGQLFVKQRHPEDARYHGLYGGDNGGPPGAEVPDPKRIQGEG